MALGDLVFNDSSVVAIQAFSDNTTALEPLQNDNRDQSALISGTISKSPQSIIRARATMGESLSPSIPSKAWAADITLELRVDGYQTKSIIVPILNKVIPPQATSGQWLLKVAFMASSPSNADDDITATAENPIYKVVMAIDNHTPINPGDSSAEQTFTLSGGAYRYAEATDGKFDAESGGHLVNSMNWPA